jgi:hypothetical protein
MFDIHQSVRYSRDGEINPDAAGKYFEGLFSEFADSPEAQPVAEKHDGLGWAATVARYAVDYLGVTPPEMTVNDFREVLFEIIPRKVSTDASSAGAIIDEMRAFWQYLERVYQLKNAGAILATLGDDAAARLEKELANPENFGMAKSFFMKGKEQGFDMTTQEGLDAFMLYHNAQLLGGMMPGPLGGMIPGPGIDSILDDAFGEEEPLSLPPSMTPKQRAELRKKRKSQRQARKRNRRKK